MAERNATLASTVQTLLEGKKYSTIKDVLVTMEPADVAGILEEIGDARIPKIFRLLPKEQAAETFAELEPELQELLIRGFSDAELHDIIEELYVDDAVDLVEEMPANVVKRILAQANPDTRKEINDLLRYPENSAGSIMTTEYVSLRPAMTVRDAINRIRSTGVDKETIYTCYVTENRKLLGQVSVKDMILCTDEKTGTWWVSSPSTTPWTLWWRRPPRISRRWPPSSPRTRPICAPTPGISSGTASPGWRC